MKKNAFFSYILHRLIIIINSFPNPYDFNVFFLESEPSLICKSDLDFLYLYIWYFEKMWSRLKIRLKNREKKKNQSGFNPFYHGSR